MATSSKFDMSSDSLDRPPYTSGQRGSHLAASLDRSGSFREGMDSPMLSSLPNMSKNSSTATRVDVVKFFQCLRFDPKVVAAEHKSSRQGDFKRHINVALGIPADDSPSSSLKSKQLTSPVPEEIKRVRAGLRDGTVKARERVKIFNESLSVLNKFFPSMPSKKRSRADGFSSDRTSAMLSSDRPVMGSGLGKMGFQSHAMTNGFELEMQKPEERTKNMVPNKRTRTSLADVKMDARGNSLARPSGAIDRDREMSGFANGSAVHGEEQSLSIGVDGWEKAKLKKKRSVIKPDLSSGMVSPKLTEGYREPKQGMQQRLVTDSRSRLNGDSHGFRPGAMNGTVGVGKSDGISQHMELGVRSSIPRVEEDTSSFLNDKRDRPTSSEKERAHLKAVNKTNIREEFNSCSPTLNIKMNASIRGPQSGSSNAPKMSPVIHRTAASNDWEISHCSNKPPAAIGSHNRKRGAPARSSSPPVTHWAGQRPQKISRTARRTSFVPVTSSNDDSSALDTTSDAACGKFGSGFVRRMPGKSPRKGRFKSDPSALSESEESGATEIKSKDKGKKSNDIDVSAGQNFQKVSGGISASRKNKLGSGKDHGDGVRRQGRSGRGLTSARSVMAITVEKFGHLGTAKQLRSARLYDKAESKVGRPPTRKLSDRKAYNRQKNAATNGATNIFVGSVDGHEELLVAANGVINSACELSSPFWRQIEPFFRYISDADVACLNQQGISEPPVPIQVAVPPNFDSGSTIPNVYGLFEYKNTEETSKTKNEDLFSEQLIQGTNAQKAIPLAQRLMAALIPEEDCDSETEGLEIDSKGIGFELGGEFESNGLDHHLNFQSWHTGTGFNGYLKGGNERHDELEINLLSFRNSGMNSSFGHFVNGDLTNQELTPEMAYSEFSYDNMLIDEKLALEMQSIGLFAETGSDVVQKDDEDIDDDISKLQEEYLGKVAMKKGLANRLLTSVLGTKEQQEKEVEERALDKLVGMAYEKYMACQGPGATGKSSSSKMAKQAALGFVKWSLDQCHRFKETGKSCFNEPLYRDMFISWIQSVDAPTDGESPKPLTSTRSLEGRFTASMSSHPSPVSLQLGHNADSYAVHSSDMLQSSGKEDTWLNKVGIGNPLSSSTKGKRSERDREGKVLSRNGTKKVGRPSLSNAKGEGKSKKKPKPKTTQLSVPLNGPVGKKSQQPKPVLPSASKPTETNTKTKGKDELSLDVFDDPDLCTLSETQDLGTWLNFDDDGLQDNDFMGGLEIPMDDLSDLNMMI